MLQFRKVSNFHREIRHAEDLTACLQKFINMRRQKEFQAVGDRALHAWLITLLPLNSWYSVQFVRQRTFRSYDVKMT